MIISCLTRSCFLYIFFWFLTLLVTKFDTHVLQQLKGVSKKHTQKTKHQSKMDGRVLVDWSAVPRWAVPRPWPCGSAGELVGLRPAVRAGVWVSCWPSGCCWLGRRKLGRDFAHYLLFAGFEICVSSRWNIINKGLCFPPRFEGTQWLCTCNSHTLLYGKLKGLSPTSFYLCC